MRLVGLGTHERTLTEAWLELHTHRLEFIRG